MAELSCPGFIAPAVLDLVVVFSVNWGNKLCMIDLGPRFPPNVHVEYGLVPGFFTRVFIPTATGNMRHAFHFHFRGQSERKEKKRKNLLLRGVCPVWNVVWHESIPVWALFYSKLWNGIFQPAKRRTVLYI